MSEALRILILEDQPADVELVTRELRKAGIEFVAKNVATEKEFLAELPAYAPEVILADYAVPGFGGLSALAAAQKLCPETPFVFVSGSLGEDKAVETLHHGATDYVAKTRLARLGPAVRRALREGEERRKGQQAEQRIRELNLVLRATGAINALMVRERDPQRLLAEACKILVETRGYQLAWIGEVEAGSKRVVSAASAGMDTGYLNAVNITWDETPAGQGPVGIAIRSGQQVACQDTATDPRFAPWKEAAQARGFASMSAMPMIQASRLLGVVAVYSGRTGAFHAEELDLLSELASDLAFALQSIEHEQERKRAEEAIIASEVRYRRLFEAAKDGILIIDAQTGMVVDVNPFLAGLLGYSREAFLGKEIWELGFFRDIVANQASFSELQETEYVRYDDKPLRGSDGRRIDVEFVSNVYLVNHQKVIQCNIRDITGRKHAELRIAAFASLGQRLNSARTAREAGEIIVGVADELLGWDACLFDLYSAAENRMTHLLSMDLIDGRRTECERPDPVPSPRELPSRAIKHGGQLILRDHPQSMWAEGTPFGDPSRPSASLMFVPIRHGTKVVGILSIQSYTSRAYDANSLEALQALADYAGGALVRLEAQEALEREHQKAQRYLDIAGVMIVAIDPSQNVLLANRKTCEILECEESDLIGHNWFEFAIPKAGRDQLKASFSDMIAGKIAPWEYVEGRVLTQRGEERLIAWHNTVLKDATGQSIATLSSGEDITERKALEVQLRQAQKMEAVGQLAGGVAHDFNNMLAVIRGNAELLLMDKERYPAEAREGLKHVVEASERAANLTRQLLAFSRKQVLQLQPVLLNTVIANLTKMLHRVLRANIDLQCHYAVPLSYVQADTGMIEQVILNLVVNARDAILEGGQLRVATEQLTLDEAHARVNPEARAGEFACLLVSDTGTGIALEVLPHIFEPFFTTKDPGKGTGLGLATVYGIVKQHQGWIEVSSRVGEGTTFKVFLPAIATPDRLSVAAEVGAVVGGGIETILLVEDEHAVRITTRRVLESKGYKIWEAASAKEALELWQSHEQEIALLLTDIIMPGKMTGRDLAERLWGQRPGLKVVFMSGYSADVLGKGTEFIRRTRSYFLQKPSTSRAILETVRKCLDQKPSGAAPAKASGTK